MQADAQTFYRVLVRRVVARLLFATFRVRVSHAIGHSASLQCGVAVMLPQYAGLDITAL